MALDWLDKYSDTGRLSLVSVNEVNAFALLFVYFAGLAFDDWDLDFYTKLFQEKIRRNPTSVECFDLAQSNR